MKARVNKNVKIDWMVMGIADDKNNPESLADYVTEGFTKHGFGGADSTELNVCEGIVSDVKDTERGIIITVKNYKNTDVVCEAPLGIGFFETEEDLRRYFGRKKD